VVFVTHHNEDGPPPFRQPPPPHTLSFPLVCRNDDYYKLMLRARAVVNARLWSGQAEGQP